METVIFTARVLNDEVREHIRGVNQKKLVATLMEGDAFKKIVHELSKFFICVTVDVRTQTNRWS